MSFQPEKITREHVLAAAQKIQDQEFKLNQSKLYDVIINNKRYPPKEIIRLAHEIAVGAIPTNIKGGDIVNTPLKRLGFEVVPKIKVWKLGCNWERGAPSFYEFIKKETIVLTVEKFLYKPGDWVLVTEGFTVRALAKVVTGCKPVTSVERYEELFGKYKIEYDSWLLFAYVEWYELQSSEIFEYKLQQGIREVHLVEILDKVDQLCDTITEREPVNSEKRLLRITWNENRWELPSGHKWRKENQGNKNIAHENQYGFGGEEWLFNPRYNIDGYQYGYIRGLCEVTNKEFINEAHLFTIASKSKNRYLVCKIKYLELLYPDNLPSTVKDVYRRESKNMVRELESVNADFSNFKLSNFYPIVRFKLSNTTFYDEPILINELKEGNKHNRFKPYKIESNIIDTIAIASNEPEFNFDSGKRVNENAAHERNINAGTVDIPGVHAMIVNDLELFLKPSYTIEKKNLSIERSRFGRNIADVVLKEEDNLFSIFEIKTSNNARYNIREALGQLLDYALWDNKVKVKKLVIVAPTGLNKKQIAYFNRLKSSLNFTLEYWQYLIETDVKPKFKII